jgi:hypothetical protein
LAKDVFRDWASIFKPQGFSNGVLAKVFPGKSPDGIFGPVAGLRDLVKRELYVVADVLQDAQQQPAVTSGTGCPPAARPPCPEPSRAPRAARW